MNNYYYRVAFLGLFLLIPLFAFAGDRFESTAQSSKEVIGKKLEITHVKFQDLDLPAAHRFVIEFKDSSHCVILINGKKQEGTWVFNERTKTIDVKNTFGGAIKSFVLSKSGSQVVILQRVNEEEMHQIIAKVLR